MSITQFVKFNTLNIAKASAAGVLNRAVSQGAENIKRSLGRNPTPTPFAAARGRKNGLILAYPFNVDEDERQGHFIKFKIKDQVSQGKLKSPKSFRQRLEDEEIGDIEFELGNERFAPTVELPSARGRTNRSLVLEKLENRQTVKQIALYMPATIDVNYTVTYGDNGTPGTYELSFITFSVFFTTLNVACKFSSAFSPNNTLYFTGW